MNRKARNKFLPDLLFQINQRREGLVTPGERLPEQFTMDVATAFVCDSDNHLQLTCNHNVGSIYNKHFVVSENTESIYQLVDDAGIRTDHGLERSWMGILITWPS
jgi:hypothetical protein